MRLPLALLLLLAVAASPCLHADNPAALKERLHKAEAESSMDLPDARPWHLRAAFQLLDSKGNVAETGTIEEWWAGPKLHKVIYTSPSYNNIELENEHGFYKAKPDLYSPYFEHEILTEIVHPLPTGVEVDRIFPHAYKQMVKKTELECISTDLLSNISAAEGTSSSPTYCFDKISMSLVGSIYVHSVVVTPLRIAMFRGKSVITDLAIQRSQVLTVKAQVEKLEGYTVSPEMFALDTSLSKCARLVGFRINPVMNNPLSKVDPKYPDRAKQNHISGSVGIHVVIGVDGHVKSSEVFTSPDDSLTKAALESVRQWVFRAYVEEGQPVEVDTLLTINFSFGS